MSFQITDTARRRMRLYLDRHPQATAVRLGVKRTGCSGYSYTVDLSEHTGSEDQVFEFHGVKLVVSSENLPLLDGTEIDFQREGLNATFVFRNPNATGACGCGESFTVER